MADIHSSLGVPASVQQDTYCSEGEDDDSDKSGVQQDLAVNNADVRQDSDSSDVTVQQDSQSQMVDIQHNVDLENSNNADFQQDLDDIKAEADSNSADAQQDMDSDKPDTGQTASETDSGSGGNQSQDSDSPIFPMASDQGSSFNYLQDLKKRKMKMKKQPASIVKNSKLLKMIHLQSKFRSTQATQINSKLPQSSEGTVEDGEPRLPNEDAQTSDAAFPGDLLGSCTTGGEADRNISLPFDSADLYHCQLCPVAFASPISLRGHMSSHKIQKKFMCPICSKSFAHSSTLNYHIRKHKGDLRYKCDICGKRFLKPFRLKAHISCVHSGEKPYICTYCNKAFSCSINLTRHTRIHTGERPFLCLLCGKRFRDNSSFALHRRYHSQNRPYECEVCGKAFIKMHFLKTHKKCVHADDKTHECFICSKAFKVRDYLRKHLITHQENKRYKCDFCEKSFPRIGSLKKHRYLHTGEEPFKCDVCSKGFRDAYTLAKHKRLHDRKIEDRSPPTVDEVNDKKCKLFECDKCERKYSLSGSLKIHKQKYCKGMKVEKEKDDRNLFCSGCGMLFHHKQSLAKHMKMTCEAVYGKKDKVFLCSTCGLVFFSRVMLNDHLRTTTCSGKETPENYKCGVCGAEFSHRATLSKHKKLHTDVPTDLADEDGKIGPDAEEPEPTKHAPLVDENGRRIFECKFCAERFRSKSALYDTHMRKCHGRPALEKKNACEQCGRKFHSKSDLRAHVRIHTGEKPFTCGVCGKSFTQRGHVSMHMKIHTGQRDFPCTICGKAFQFATTLRNHVKIHTGERPHVCDLCGKGFIKYNNLKNHLAQHEKKNKLIKQEPELELDQVMTLDQDNTTVTVSPVKKTASGKLVAQARKKTSTPGTRKSTRSSRGSSMKKLIEQEMNPVEQFDEVKVEPVDFDEEGAIESTLSSGEHEHEMEDIPETESPKTKEEIAIELKCPFCDESMPNAYELATHIKSHTGNRPFMCKDCGKSFILASHLRCHMQVHGKKQQEYRCLVCTEQFSSAKILQEHMRSHKGERPYGCYFCDKTYGTSQHLRRHVRCAHPDKIDIDMNMLHMPANTLNDGNAEEEEVDESGKRIFRCKFCDKVYLKNQHLLRHTRTSHPDWLDKGRDYQPNDSENEVPGNVKIKTEIVWDSENMSAEDADAWNVEDKYNTPDSLRSDDSSTNDSCYKDVQSPCAENAGKSQERIYIPPKLRGDLDSPVKSATSGNVSEASDTCSPTMCRYSDDQGTDASFVVEIKQEPTDSEYDVSA